MIAKTKISSFASAITDRAPRDTIPVYSVTKHNGFVKSSEYFKKVVHSKDLTNYKFVPNGTFAYSTIHLDEGSVGYALEDCLISPMYTVFSIDENRVDRQYLFYLLKSSQMLAQYQRLGDGSVHRRRSVSFERFGQLIVPLPPLQEQKRIAAILDQADALRRKRQRALDRLNQLGQAIFYEMFGDPATNPKSFPALLLGEVIEFVGGSQPPKTNFLYEPGPDRVRFIQTRDFRTDKYPTYVPKSLAKRPFTEADVMIGRYGPPVFQIFRGLSGTYNVALMKAKPKQNVTSDFIFFLLQEPKLHSYVVANSERTAGQSGVNLDLLEKYPAYAPPTELLLEFSKRVTIVDAQVALAREAFAQAESLFTSLQHRAFKGEL